MSVEIEYGFWPQFNKWTITIRSKRRGPPETESESTYVLPEAVVRGLAESYAIERRKKKRGG